MMFWPSGANLAPLIEPWRKVSRWNVGVLIFFVCLPPKKASTAVTINAIPTTTPGAILRLAWMDLSGVVEVKPEIVSRSKARSRADWKRPSGCFSKQWRTIRPSAGVMFGADSLMSFGSSFRIAFMISTELSPVNGRLPESIS